MKLPPQATLIKWGIYAAIAVVLFLSVRSFYGDIKEAIFGNPEVIEAEAKTVVAEEEGRAVKETSQEATKTVVRTYERHVEVDRTVKEGQNAVNRADKGQQMDPEIDAAVADGLCRVHDDLCREPR